MSIFIASKFMFPMGKSFAVIKEILNKILSHYCKTMLRNKLLLCFNIFYPFLYRYNFSCKYNMIKTNIKLIKFEDQISIGLWTMINHY